MIVSEIYSGSGLGNQLWNLIVPRIIAERYGYEWGAKKSNPFKGSEFMTSYDFGKKVISGYGPEGGPPIQLPKGIVNYYKERFDPYPQNMGGDDAMIFDDFLWNNLEDNTKIEGCFQKIGYIRDRRDDIIEWLKPDLSITDFSKDDICVIQFRGGDYLTGSAWCPPEYYNNAAKVMQEINPSMKFVVITDDPINAQKFMPWAIIVGSAVMEEKDLLQGSIGWYKYPGGPIGVDYSILNNAKYAIISASTFSFWPCWTNTQFKTIIAPKYWTDFKISNGWWRGDDNIVDQWLYLDMKGNPMIGSDCRIEYDKYRSQNSFYSNLK